MPQYRNILKPLINTKSMSEKKNVLENGTYSVYGPDSGAIEFERLELHSGSGAKRVWKVRHMSEKEIVLDIEKFA